MNYIPVIMAMFMLSSIALHAENDSSSPTTSLIIPCCAHHAHHLFGLLKMYEQQTQLPDEVIISLSESKKVSSSILTQLHEETWAFPVTLLLYKQKFFAGQNRNNACLQAKNDIFICQDADDIPHPQRIEIIAYLFKKYRVDHLIHQMIADPENKTDFTGVYVQLNENASISFLSYALESIPFFFPKDFEWEVWRDPRYTHGAIAITRQVFNTVQWNKMPRGQDSVFNQRVYDKFKRCMAIKMPLYIYRPTLSSLRTAPNMPKLAPYPEYTGTERRKQYTMNVFQDGKQSN